MTDKELKLINRIKRELRQHMKNQTEKLKQCVSMRTKVDSRSKEARYAMLGYAAAAARKNLASDVLDALESRPFNIVGGD